MVGKHNIFTFTYFLSASNDPMYLRQLYQCMVDSTNVKSSFIAMPYNQFCNAISYGQDKKIFHIVINVLDIFQSFT